MEKKSFLKRVGYNPLLYGMSSLTQLNPIFNSFSITERMPLLFMGHGSPMNAIEDNEFVASFRNIAKDIPKPNAILCISAHWYTNGTKVTAMEMPRTIHDFCGFPKILYDIEYPVLGSPKLAQEIKQLLDPIVIKLDQMWGLDHGAWSVIKHLYPKADIPVIQLSIDYTKQAVDHYELGQKLKPLRNKGILIIGSGNIIHNLRLIDFQNFHKDNYGYDWAIEVKDTINHLILEGNYQPLMNYKKQSKAFQLAIPSSDHFLPLLYILSLQEKGEIISLFNDKLVAGSLSMTSLKIV